MGIRLNQPDPPAAPREVPAEATDEQLACRVQAGCRASFDELDRRYRGRLRGFLIRRVGQAADAEDVAAVTLATAYTKIDQFRTEARFATWLFTIAVRKAIDHRRRQRRRPTVPLDVEAAPADRIERPEESVVDAERRENLWAVAKGILSPMQYEALWLHYVERASVEEVGAVLGRSRVWVKVNLFRARRKLADHLGRVESRASARSGAAEDGRSRRVNEPELHPAGGAP